MIFDEWERWSWQDFIAYEPVQIKKTYFGLKIPATYPMFF